MLEGFYANVNTHYIHDCSDILTSVGIHSHSVMALTNVQQRSNIISKDLLICSLAYSFDSL